ncbi:MAG: hypothetical protein KDN19_19000 [Verrucomicrobiae bacterium]|nr:hypothetical protein [Verrucomicrobiae bacterium]
MSIDPTFVQSGKEPITWPEELAYPRINVAPDFQVVPDWPNRPAEFYWEAISGVWVDERDRVWLYTRGTPAIQVYSAEGDFLFSWLADSTGGAHHLKMDAEGRVWLADLETHTVRKYTRDGELLLTLGTPGESGADERHLFAPTDMAFASNGDIFVSDGYGNARVVHYDRDGNYLKSWGSLGTGDEEFSLPHAIAIDSRDRIYVADRNNVRIQVFDTAGTLLESRANVIVPWGFWVSENDDLWVCGSTPMHWTDDPVYRGFPLGCPPKDQVLMRFDREGRVLQTWSAPKGRDGEERPGELNWVHALAFDSKGALYLGEVVGNRLQKFVPKTI